MRVHAGSTHQRLQRCTPSPRIYSLLQVKTQANVLGAKRRLGEMLGIFELSVLRSPHTIVIFITLALNIVVSVAC